MSPHGVGRRVPWLAATITAAVLVATVPAALWMASTGAGVPGLIVTTVLPALAAAIAVRLVVTGPLRDVRQAIHQLTRGDFSARRRPRRGEIDDVMHALDDLAGLVHARLDATQSAERRYRLLFEHNPAALFRTRPDGRVVDCNPAAVRILGFDSVTDLTTRNARCFYADPQERAVLVDHLAVSGTVTNLEIVMRRKDGRDLPVVMNVTRVQEGGETYFEGGFVAAAVEGATP